MSPEGHTDAFPMAPLLSLQPVEYDASTLTANNQLSASTPERGGKTSDFSSNQVLDEPFDPYHRSPWLSANDADAPSTDLDGLAHTSPSTHVGNVHRLRFAVALPALISAIAVAGAATALLVYLLSRRIIAHDSSQEPAFRGAIVAHEPAVNNIFSMLVQTAGASNSNVSNSAPETTLYGLALSSVAVSFVKSFRARPSHSHIACRFTLCLGLRRLSSVSLGSCLRPSGFGS